MLVWAGAFPVPSIVGNVKNKGRLRGGFGKSRENNFIADEGEIVKVLRRLKSFGFFSFLESCESGDGV